MRVIGESPRVRLSIAMGFTIYKPPDWTIPAVGLTEPLEPRRSVPMAIGHDRFAGAPPSSLDLVDALGVAAVLVDRLPTPAAPLRRALAEAVPRVLGEFYARLAAVPEFAALLGDGPRIARLRREQERYWRLLLERPFDGGRLTVVRHVAEVHWRLAIEPRVLALAYGFVAERLVEQAALPAEARFEVLRWFSFLVS